MKLLYAEDERSMSDAVCDILAYHNYIVDPVYNGDDAYEYALNGNYDAIILDIMMPKADGIQVLTKLRKAGINLPVLLLSAKSEVEDRIKGLDSGADDYLQKPFDMGELLARVRALLRRREQFSPDVILFGDITLNMQSYELKVKDSAITLPRQEYRLIEQLMLNTSIYLSSEDLLVKAWGYDTESDIGIVWLYISYLRKRLSELKSEVKIVSKRNLGYRLEVKK